MKAVISYYSILFSQKFIPCKAITCSSLSDSGGRRESKRHAKRGQWREKGNSFLSFYFHIRAYADQTISETGTEARAV